MATYVNIPASNTTLNKASYVNIPAAGTGPTTVANLELWLDGRDLVGTDGTAISSWTPRAGGASGTAAVQATGALQPLVKSGANGLNGNPVARFDGSNDVLIGTLNAGAVGFTIYIVGRSGGALTAFGNVVGSGGNVACTNPTTGIDWGFAYGSNAGGFGAGWGGTAEDVALGNVTGVAINTAFRFRYQTNKVAWSIVGPNTGTPADTSFPTGTFQCHVGAGSVNSTGPVTQFPFTGDVASILVYSRALTAGEDTTVMTYLQTTWGV